jgi:hypothetical protein
MYQANITNKFVEVKTLDDIQRFWPFFLEGLGDLNDPHKGRGDLTPESLFKQILHAISADGLVLVLTSKNDKPLAFVIAREDTEPLCVKSLLVYAAYSSGKCATAQQEGQAYMENWARDRRFVEIHAFSRRINGSAIRWFTKKCGFKQVCIGFKKLL